jgi:hypothetical protein
VVGIEPTSANTALLVECPACRSVFKSPLYTVAGLPLGIHRCTGCGEEHRAEPADVVAAVQRHWPAESEADIAGMTTDLMDLTARWHQHAAWASALTYGGVNLGACMQHDLIPFIATRLTAAGPSTGEEA